MMINDVESIVEKNNSLLPMVYTGNETAKVIEKKPRRNPIPIDDIDILSDCDDYDAIPVIVELPYYLLKKLKENVKRKWQTQETHIGFALEEMIRGYNSNFGLKTPPLQALKFEGREPRKDVLLKLRTIASDLEYEEGYPWLGLKQIRRCIKEALGNPDSRTLDKYYQCIAKFIRLKGGQEKIEVWDAQNLAGLSDVINEKLRVISKDR